MTVESLFYLHILLRFTMRAINGHEKGKDSEKKTDLQKIWILRKKGLAKDSILRVKKLCERLDFESENGPVDDIDFED